MPFHRFMPSPVQQDTCHARGSAPAPPNRYNELVAGGDKHLFYVTGNQLLDIDNDLVNPTVSGTHPTDLGM